MPGIGEAADTDAGSAFWENEPNPIVILAERTQSHGARLAFWENEAKPETARISARLETAGCLTVSPP